MFSHETYLHQKADRKIGSRQSRAIEDFVNQYQSIREAVVVCKCCVDREGYNFVGWGRNTALDPPIFRLVFKRSRQGKYFRETDGTAGGKVPFPLKQPHSYFLPAFM